MRAKREKPICYNGDVEWEKHPTPLFNIVENEMRDISETQYREALLRHRFRVSNTGSMVVHVTDEEINHSFGWMFSRFNKLPRRQRLAILLQTRDKELEDRAARAKAKEKKRRDTAATLGIDPDTGLPLYSPLGYLAAA